MIHGERAFWENVLRQTNPDWAVRLSDEAEVGSLSQLDAAFYVAHMRYPLVFAGTASVAQWQTALEQSRGYPESDEEITSAAVKAVIALCEGGRQPQPAQQVYLLKLAMLALGRTQLYAMQRERNGLRGGWLYMVYEGRNGGGAGRPVKLPGDTAKLADPDELMLAIEHVKALDLQPGTSVYRVLKECGGARFAKKR